jgi:multiple sugar transport system permease protein
MRASAPALPAERATAGEAMAGYVLAAPAFVFLVSLFIMPVFGVVVLATTDWKFGAQSFAFVGLRNFADLWSDPVFRISAVNTALYVAVVVPTTVVLGLAVALLIESGRSLRTLYRAAHFLPFMATLAATSIAWEMLLHPTVGLVNQLLSSLGLPTANWLRDPHTALPVLAAIGIWQDLGFVMVLFLAGLKSIPQELYDAADVDGADRVLDRLRTVTLPLLGPVTMFVVIVVTLKELRVFDTVKILTEGGPAKSSEVLLYTLYIESFEYLRTGYGAAITVIFLGVVVALTLLQAKFMDRRVHYS